MARTFHSERLQNAGMRQATSSANEQKPWDEHVDVHEKLRVDEGLKGPDGCSPLQPSESPSARLQS